MVKDLRNKFSLDMNIGLLGLKFSVIITLKGVGNSENFRFLHQARFEINIEGGALVKFFRFLHNTKNVHI